MDGLVEIEYPKYPIEMLWEAAGDCEDATALYISLMENLGFDAILIILNVKSSEDESWGGHAMPGISVSGGSGTYYYLDSGSKANVVRYYMAEATNYCGVGVDCWYDRGDIYAIYDIE